jgi:hypothetical protein
MSMDWGHNSLRVWVMVYFTSSPRFLVASSKVVDRSLFVFQNLPSKTSLLLVCFVWAGFVFFSTLVYERPTVQDISSYFLSFWLDLFFWVIFFLGCFGF